MKRLPLALVALSLLAPGLAAAQEAAPQLQDDPRAARFKDVERGFFIGFDVGTLVLLDTPTAEPDRFPYAGADGGSAIGMLVGAHAGVDLGSRVAISVYGVGGNERASVSYGAFSIFAAGVDLRVALLGMKDRNDFERFFVYVHGRGGYAKTYPEGLFGTDDVLVQAGVGVEYFTRLRHFSVGAAIDGVRATKAKANGIAVYPTVRYTF